MSEPVLLITATELEAAPLRAARAGRPGPPLAVVGMGASGVEALRRQLQRYRPQLVIAFGLAGALTTRLPVGATIITRRWLDANGAARGESPPDARDRVRQTLSRSAIDPIEVDVVTVSAPFHGVEARDALHAATGAAAVEMEGAHWSAAAASAGVPLVSIRVISDRCDLPLPLPRHLLLRADGSARWLRWAGALVRRGGAARLPAEWRRLRRARREWSTALRALARAADALSGTPESPAATR